MKCRNFILTLGQPRHRAGARAHTAAGQSSPPVHDSVLSSKSALVLVLVAVNETVRHPPSPFAPGKKDLSFGERSLCADFMQRANWTSWYETTQVGGINVDATSLCRFEPGFPLEFSC